MSRPLDELSLLYNELADLRNKLNATDDENEVRKSDIRDQIALVETKIGVALNQTPKNRREMNDGLSKHSSNAVLVVVGVTILVLAGGVGGLLGYLVKESDRWGKYSVQQIGITQFESVKKFSVVGSLAFPLRRLGLQRIEVVGDDGSKFAALAPANEQFYAGQSVKLKQVTYVNADSDYINTIILFVDNDSPSEDSLQQRK